MWEIKHKIVEKIIQIHLLETPPRYFRWFDLFRPILPPEQRERNGPKILKKYDSHPLILNRILQKF